MPDVTLDLPIKALPSRVFEFVSTPHGLDVWWSKTSSGRPAVGEEYQLGFGPGYDWLAKVTRCAPDSEFELELVQADADWTGSIVGFRLEPRGAGTWLQFRHRGWPEANEHYRISCNCWAAYLRILRRHLEHGESVPYEQRLDV